MVKLELKNHQVWQDFTEIVKQLDIDTLIKEHLDLCNYQVCGYWDEQDKYYQTINLPRSLEIELISSFIGFEHQKRFLQLKFNLKNLADFTKIGELLLIYDENLQFIDENWILDSDFLECRVR
ncbi:MAG TPA: hypothetical protein VK184_24190 [Nostocaceae cyanobacterium]|nr:hypothetical protein [Nostocaceae cyanobacterium]